MKDLKPFKSDGCSGWFSPTWKLVTGRLPPWEGLCIEHDRSYWRGGTSKGRLESDEALRQGIIAMGHPIWAETIFRSVRAGGHPWLPTKWRWGFGSPYPYPRHLYYRD